MWRNTFDEYRPDELLNAYQEIHWKRVKRLATEGKAKEAADRARGDAWDLERRNAYLKRNSRDLDGVDRLDPTVHVDDWFAG